MNRFHQMSLKFQHIRILEEEMVEAIKFAHEFIKKQCDAQEKLAKAYGKKETREYEPSDNISVVIFYYQT